MEHITQEIERMQWSLYISKMDGNIAEAEEIEERIGVLKSRVFANDFDSYSDMTGDYVESIGRIVMEELGSDI